MIGDEDEDEDKRRGGISQVSSGGKPLSAWGFSLIGLSAVCGAAAKKGKHLPTDGEHVFHRNLG
jgi:hypothetical protein